MPLIVDDFYELLALHRALFEVRFISDPNDPAVPASPFIGKIAERTIAAIVELGREYETAEGWEKWKRIKMVPNSREWNTVLSEIKGSEKWGTKKMEEKKAYLEERVLPLKLSDETLDLLIRDAEN